MNGKITAIISALLAAVFYAVNVPASKLLLDEVSPTMMAALLYLGAGAGIGIVRLWRPGVEAHAERFTGRDLPYIAGMILLDIAAPICLMLGIRLGTSSNASLLGNFEIVATTLIALALFKEPVSRRLWAAVGLIALSSALLSFEGAESLRFSKGSLFVLLATLCWGLENNCTRALSSKSAFDIVILKGIFSGGGSLLIALARGESFPDAAHIALTLLLGFVAYGLSIFLYVRAQASLGAARTSAYYAAAPFFGAFLSFLLLREPLSGAYLAALLVMLAGSALVVMDTLIKSHAHAHSHTYTHTHDGTTHTHTVSHVHAHNHFLTLNAHGHHHSRQELETHHA